ncbi:hypothetical protein L6452_22069 [Arctium lappa]|uniref:Uncharacterized protein n=1 Tax=Arctium lappa TaxID=4217 RepID=A0ACB9AXW9_ARCLA|nr:hypothetical protein L6452_22069 [Arctium lappa]
MVVMFIQKDVAVRTKTEEMLCLESADQIFLTDQIDDIKWVVVNLSARCDIRNLVKDLIKWSENIHFDNPPEFRIIETLP